MIGLGVALSACVCCSCCAAGACLCWRRRSKKRDVSESKLHAAEAECGEDPRDTESPLPRPDSVVTDRYAYDAATAPALPVAVLALADAGSGGIDTRGEARGEEEEGAAPGSAAGVDAALLGAPVMPLRLERPGKLQRSAASFAERVEAGNGAQSSTLQSVSMLRDGARSVAVVELEGAESAGTPSPDIAAAPHLALPSESFSIVLVPPDAGRNTSEAPNATFEGTVDVDAATQPAELPTAGVPTLSPPDAHEGPFADAEAEGAPSSGGPIAVAPLRRHLSLASFGFNSAIPSPASSPLASSRALPPSRGAVISRPVSRPGGVTVVRSVRSRAAQRGLAAGRAATSGGAALNSTAPISGGDSSESPVVEEILGEGVDGVGPQLRVAFASVGSLDEDVDAEVGCVEDLHASSGLQGAVVAAAQARGEHSTIRYPTRTAAPSSYLADFGMAPLPPPQEATDALLCDAFESLFNQETPRGAADSRVSLRAGAALTAAAARASTNAVSDSSTSSIQATASFVNATAASPRTTAASLSVAQQGQGPPGEAQSVLRMVTRPPRRLAQVLPGPAHGQSEKESSPTEPAPLIALGAEQSLIGANNESSLQRGGSFLQASISYAAASSDGSHRSPPPRGDFSSFLEGLLQQETPRDGHAPTERAAIATRSGHGRHGLAAEHSPSIAHASPATAAPSPPRVLAWAQPAPPQSSPGHEIPAHRPSHQTARERAWGLVDEATPPLDSYTAPRIPDRFSDAGRGLRRSHTVGPAGPTWDASPQPRPAALIRQWIAGAAAATEEEEGLAVLGLPLPEPAHAPLPLRQPVRGAPPAWATAARGPLARRRPPDGVSPPSSWIDQLREEREAGTESGVATVPGSAGPLEDWWAQQKLGQQQQQQRQPPPQPARGEAPAPAPRFMRPTQSRLRLLQPPPQPQLHRSLSGPSLVRPQWQAAVAGESPPQLPSSRNGRGTVRRRVQPHDWGGSLRADGLEG